MNNKRWAVVGIALLLVIASGISSIGLRSEEESRESDPYTRFFRGNEYGEEVLEQGSSNERILVIPVEGVIAGSQIPTDYSQDLTLAAIEAVEEDPTIRGVLLSVDSPGGTVYETREIYDRMTEVREATGIPVYAAMGSQAASGGYYVSMAADEIYASPETVTGSIGVILNSYNLEGLMDNLGIEENTFKTGEMKDILSSSREVTAEEGEVLQTYIDESFDSFVDVVVENRNMQEEEVRELADGRIYSGQQAAENNLIDQLGYQKDALNDLKQDYGLEGAQVFQLEDMAFSFDSFLPQIPLFSSETSGSSEVRSLINDIEELQGITIEYRFKGGS